MKVSPDFLAPQRAAGAVSWVWQPGTGGICWGDGFDAIVGFDPTHWRDGAQPDFAAWLERVHPKDRAHAQAGAAQIGTGSGRFEYRVERAGEVRWLEAIGRVQSRDAAGEPVTACGLVIDVTERKAAEASARQSDEQMRAHLVAERERAEAALRQAQKLEAIGQLTGGIAHDFNNLLSAISGSLELLQTRLAQGREAESGRYIGSARRAAERAAALTQRLLAFARRQALDPKPVQADQLVRGIVELIRRTVGPGIEVDTLLEAGSAAAFCDANQLESVLLNLAINARDAMPRGGALRLSTALRRFEPGEAPAAEGARAGDYIEIGVSDTGIGMTPEVRERAFDPFFTTKPVGQGTGLGLSQTYGFVRQSDGFVLLESEPGHGTTIRLLLPNRDDGAEVPVSSPPPNGATLRRLGASVLIVEDETTLRELLGEALEELGCQVLAAADGPAGLAIVRSAAKIDLLVTDVGLPGLDGRLLAEAARALRPTLPVLFITGYASDSIEMPDHSDLPAGMEVIGKPFTLAALTGRLARMIGVRVD